MLLLFLVLMLGELLSSVWPLSLDTTTWRAEAVVHRKEMLQLLYPSLHAGDNNNLKYAVHAVDSNPIFNFLHTYYRYPTNKVLNYSPGLGVQMEGVSVKDVHHSKATHPAQAGPPITAMSTTGCLSPYGLSLDESSGMAHYNGANVVKEKEVRKLKNFMNILTESSMRQPVFNCYGLHEWAMLYSGRRDGVQSPDLMNKHQKVPLRVSQEVIDELVEGQKNGCSLKCTHYDAYRFFHPSSQGINSITNLSRKTQTQYEQGGCIHATMDLFKYAFTLYPFCNAELLRKTLHLALAARKIDMRSSPYEVSEYLSEEEKAPLRVETVEGRRKFAVEQESLYHRSMPVRAALIIAYNEYLESIGHGGS